MFPGWTLAQVHIIGCSLAKANLRILPLLSISVFFVCHFEYKYQIVLVGISVHAVPLAFSSLPQGTDSCSGYIITTQKWFSDT